MTKKALHCIVVAVYYPKIASMVSSACRCYSYLFWSDGTNGDAKIERSDLSGQSRTVLVSSAQGLVSPTTLVVDFSSEKLYWLDSAAQKISRVNFDGSGIRVWTGSRLGVTTAFTIYQVLRSIDWPSEK